MRLDNLISQKDGSIHIDTTNEWSKWVETLQYFFEQTKGQNAARVARGFWTQKGNTTFLTYEFFAAGGNMWPAQRRAIILLHESVHQFGNLFDDYFGGSQELTRLIVGACYPVLAGQLGGID